MKIVIYQPLSLPTQKNTPCIKFGTHLLYKKSHISTKRLLLLFSHSVVSDSFWDPGTIAHQAPLSLGFSRQESWSRLPLPSPRDLPDLGIEPEFPALAGGFFTTEPSEKPLQRNACMLKSLQLCPTLCDPGDHSSVHGVLQARTLDWVVMPFSRESSGPRDETSHLLCLLHWRAGSLPLAPPGISFTKKKAISELAQQTGDKKFKCPGLGFTSGPCELRPVTWRLIRGP